MTLRRVLRRVAPVVVAAGGLLIGTATAFAYPPPGSTVSVASASSTCSAGAHCTVTFRVRDASGNPITGETLCFTVAGPVSGSSVAPTCSVSDATGAVQAVFTAGAGSCGTETVTGTAQAPSSGSATASITVPCTGGATLPATSATPPGPSPVVYVLIALGVVVVLGGAVTLRRTRPAATN